MSEHAISAFLASTYSSDAMKRLRLNVHDIGQAMGHSVWIAECEGVSPDSGDPVGIVDQCIAALRQADVVFFVTDGTFGSNLSVNGRLTSASHVEMELFQAAVLGKPGLVLVIGNIEPQSDIARLLEVLEFAYPRTEWQFVKSHSEAQDAIVAILSQPESSLRSRQTRRSALVAGLAHLRHLDFSNVHLGKEIEFLDRSIDATGANRDLSFVEDLLSQAAVVKNSEMKFARYWIAMRQLMSQPYWETNDLTVLRLWDRTLGGWASCAAWYGLHAHIYMGHLAALGSIAHVRNKVEASKLDTSGERHSANLEGALGSCYYSLSKLAPRSEREQFRNRAAAYVDVGLAKTPLEEQAGLLAIRGSIRLQAGNLWAARADYKQALSLSERSGASTSEKAVYLSELGWAEVLTGHLGAGVRHLREGLDLLSHDGNLGMRVRATRKLGLALATHLNFLDSIRTLDRAHRLAQQHQLEGQIRSDTRLANKTLDALASWGFDLRDDRRD